jgi:methylornithine synthase
MDAHDIINRAERGLEVAPEEIAALMSAATEDVADELFAAARRVRDRVFGNTVFLYGFVYFSTYCKNNCAFCYYRRTNDLPRYRKTREEVLTLSASLEDAGVNLVDLTMGEDPLMYVDGHANLIDLVQSVDDTVDIAVMVSPGAIDRAAFPALREAGADWFACYQETYNPQLFARLRLEQDFGNRMDQRRWAREAGILAEDGMLVGMGETAQDRAEAVLRMGGSGCEQIRAMTFVPQAGTPMQGLRPQDSSAELQAIAVMRLLYPDRLIPASLDVEGIAGLRPRLDAGANVITSIIPPHQELAGVAQPELNIEDGHRSVDYVIETLEGMGRRIATDAEYRAFVEAHRPRGGC